MTGRRAGLAARLMTPQVVVVSLRAVTLLIA